MTTKMNQQELADVEKKLDEALSNIKETNESHLFLIKEKHDEEVKNIINNFSNEIRNISIASGIIAPFSLTLLDVKSININTTFVLIGFLVLLFNIALSNILMSRFIKYKDSKIAKATFNFVLAETHAQNTQNSTRDYSQRVNDNFDFHKHITEAGNILGLSKFDMSSQIDKKTLRGYQEIILQIFSIGIIFIMLSILVNPFMELIC